MPALCASFLDRLESVRKAIEGHLKWYSQGLVVTCQASLNINSFAISEPNFTVWPFDDVTGLMTGPRHYARPEQSNAPYNKAYAREVQHHDTFILGVIHEEFQQCKKRTVRIDKDLICTRPHIVLGQLMDFAGREIRCLTQGFHECSGSRLQHQLFESKTLSPAVLSCSSEWTTWERKQFNRVLRVLRQGSYIVIILWEWKKFRSSILLSKRVLLMLGLWRSQDYAIWTLFDAILDKNCFYKQFWVFFHAVEFST